MLLENWKMDFGDYSGLDCTVPCDMYGVLERYGYIDDPYYGINEEKLCPLSGKDATFYTAFSLDEKALNYEHVVLCFYGLDTICDIYLNGRLLDSVKNMHRAYEYDVTDIVAAENALRLEFKSPLEYFARKEKEHHLYSNDYDTVSGAAHLRKALYMSGWDWAPKLPNMGIFRPVEIKCYNTDLLGDVSIIQRHEGGEVTLSVAAGTRHSAPDTRIECTVDGNTFTLADGMGEITVKSPRLWWPRGYGEQNLYDVEVALYKGDVLLDKQTKKIGLRTLYLSREDDPDGQGQEFCFVVNGIKIFAMGANYVPIESVLSKRTNQRLEQLIKDCVFANFNCVRVWGGAFYPDDYFYDLCDKYGLIVWQDFMVACANVWLTEEMEREFTEEAIYNVKRIRHHACLGILCGNNEMEEAICFWPCANGDDPLVRKDYLKLYEDIFPAICKEYAPYISYTPSSPTSGGGFDSPQDCTRGDVHFWHVWNGNCEFDEYRRHKFRFCSEYGFESLPSIKTIEAFCPENERNLLSYTMESHQKHVNGNVKLLKYLAERYLMPKNLETTAYASQLNQATAIKYGVEHFRRNRGYTMGSIYWQLNDPWPVASWSSIDYFGRYKALHYFAKRFYQPVALGLFNENDKIIVNVASESTTEFKGRVKWGICKNDFTAVSEGQVDFKVNALESLDVLEMPNSGFNRHRDAYFYAELYDDKGVLIARNTELGAKPKHFNFIKPEISVTADRVDCGVALSFSSSALAKDVEVTFKDCDVVLSDNYFDLLSPTPYTVIARTDLSPKELLEQIKILSVYDIAN